MPCRKESTGGLSSGEYHTSCRWEFSVAGKVASSVFVPVHGDGAALQGAVKS